LRPVLSFVTNEAQADGNIDVQLHHNTVSETLIRIAGLAAGFLSAENPSKKIPASRNRHQECSAEYQPEKNRPVCTKSVLCMTIITNLLLNND